MAATAQVGEDNVIKGGDGSGGNHDTGIAVAEPATALVGGSNVVAKGGNGLDGVINPATAQVGEENVVVKGGAACRKAIMTPATPAANYPRP